MTINWRKYLMPGHKSADGKASETNPGENSPASTKPDPLLNGTADPSTVVADPRYYADGQRWENSVYRSIGTSRNAWRAIALIAGATTIASIGLLWATLPLKQMDVVVLEVDKTTGFVEASQPLQERGDLTQNEAVLRANIVRFLRARETYDPKALNDNYQLAMLYSTGKASEDVARIYSRSNPDNPMEVYGADTIITVQVKSVSFPGSNVAFVRFDTTQSSQQGIIVSHWVANLRYRYTSEPMRNDWRFDNPLGFQVLSYQRDQETVSPDLIERES